MLCIDFAVKITASDGPNVLHDASPPPAYERTYGRAKSVNADIQQVINIMLT
jgi:hypothetical protein